MLRDMLRRADMIEIFEYDGDAPRSWVRLEDPREWEGLDDDVRFARSFWGFSSAPAGAVVVQMIRDRQRYGVVEVRGDGCLHVRKAARWYKMPIEGAFEERVRSLLERKGAPLPPRDAKPPSSVPPENRFRY